MGTLGKLIFATLASCIIVALEHDQVNSKKHKKKGNKNKRHDDAYNESGIYFY